MDLWAIGAKWMRNCSLKLRPTASDHSSGGWAEDIGIDDMQRRP